MFPLTSSWRPTRIHCMQENRFMHLASLVQQRELMRYMNSLNDWLGNDVADRQAELLGVSARIDQLHDDLNRLGRTRGAVCKVTLHYRRNTALISSFILVPPQQPGLEPGGFMVPGGQGAPVGAPTGPVRPGTAPPIGSFPPPPQPQISFPQAGPQYGPGLQPTVVIPPGPPYGTPTPSESPVIPSPPSVDGRAPFVPPEFQFRDSAAPPIRVYQPPVPMGEEDMFIPPEPSPQGSFRTHIRTPSESRSTESPRPASMIPTFVPGPQIVPQPQLLPQPSGPAPPILVYPPSQGSQYPRPPSRSTDRTRSPSPPLHVVPSDYRPGGPTVINLPAQPPQQVPAAPPGPGVTFAPSTQRADDARAPLQTVPSAAQPPVVQILPSPRPPRSEYSDYEARPEFPQQPGHPIIIHPPPQPHGVHIGPYPPVGPPGVILQERPSRSRTRSRSTTRTRSTQSPRSPLILSESRTPPPQPQVVLPPAQPGFVVPAPPGFVPPHPGFGIAPAPPPVTVVTPSRYRPESPEYRSHTPESPRGAYPPSHAPSRYSEQPIQPIHPVAAVPSAVHIVPSEPYPRSRRGRRYSESRTPSSERSRSGSRERRRLRRRERHRSRTPSTDSEERRERRRDRRRRRRREDASRSRSPSYSGSPRSRRRYYSPSRVHPIPTEYGRAGPSILPPPSVTHVHTYPPPHSPSIISRPLTEGETEPLQHPYGLPSQYAPSQPIPVPISGAPSRLTRPSRAPTVVEVTGPERIHVLPPDHARPRTESTRKYCTKTYSLQLTNLLSQPITPRCLDPCLTYTKRKGEADHLPSKANFAAQVQVFRLYLSSHRSHHAAPLPQKAFVLQKTLVPEKALVFHQNPTKFLGLPLFPVKGCVMLRPHPVLASQECRARPQHGPFPALSVVSPPGLAI